MKSPNFHWPNFLFPLSLFHLVPFSPYHLITISLFLFFSTGMLAQNEANIWYFQKNCGFDFNSGDPQIILNGQIYYEWSSSTISDSMGNFLFGSDGEKIYTQNGIMLNSNGMPHTGYSGSVIVKWPGSPATYYLFTAANPATSDQGFYYSLIDMDLNDGNGGIVEKNVFIDAGWDVSDRIAVSKKKDSEDVWVIVKKNVEDGIAAFLVDENGFHSDPIISELPDGAPGEFWKGEQGQIKISSNKKFLIEKIEGSAAGICQFDAENGHVNLLYRLRGQIPSPYFGLIAYEFSPDSKYLYTIDGTDSDLNELYQYDMQYVYDSAMFRNSAILIGSGYILNMQLARDGRIYCTPVLKENSWHNTSVIQKPWVRGTGCMFEHQIYNFSPNEIAATTYPNILVDYLLRFEWTGEQCQGYPINFKPNFIPTPDSIVWNFDDQLAPGSLTNELFPTYAFQHPGIHEVKVDVWYPSGRYEHTSREIEISPSPLPLLGNDTLICNSSLITLNANCDADFFTWSTGQFGVSSITVSDSGTYWVKGRFNDSGCEGYDTIHIGFHPPTIIDETNLQIIPTTCNGASGSITGITALGSPPFAFQWLDLSGNPFGTNIDATNLPAGQYQLTITDGNGCETVSNVYTIEDAGNLEILNVELTQPHCERPDGQIIVHALNPAGSALQYSIDDGATYQADSVFSGLFGADYVIRVSDGVGCFGFYIDNPVLLEDIPGPQVTQVNVTDETDFLGNGAIEIMANGSTPVIYYSIDGGTTWQENDGNFENLEFGIWNLVIRDENGCDTTFTVEIQNVILTYLHAVTGEGGHCLGNTAMVPVNVDNFNSVADFHLKLGYNDDNLECEGFTNVNLQLLDSLTGWVDHAAGDIHLAWQSPTSVSFPGTEKVADLVFTSKNPGQGELAWYTGTSESYFTNSSGNPIPAEFQTGEVKIYEPPEIILDQSKTVCTGQFVSIMSIAIGNQNPISYRWIYPNGDTTSNDPFFFSVTSSDAGLYTLLATDRVGCTDQKSIELIVRENPVAAFHGTDTLEMQADDVLDAGSGLSSYLWNTGDSTESIVINAEGIYKVEMESPVGCLGSDSVYIKLVSEEIPEFEIYIPNAFTPDGDGVNDVFKVAYEGISNFDFRISIFDRWGEEVFSSSGIAIGWDGKKNGKDCPGGVYVYKIVFELDEVTGSQERVGVVMLVK
jgi:gliding motility-associated-like protein